MLKLYHYWRSSASYRVRIALAYKSIPVELFPVDLMTNGGEQYSTQFFAINPQARVPFLVLENGTVLTQSMAIIEWLEEAYPKPALMPKGVLSRLRVREIVDMIGCDIHPLNNTSPLNYLRANFGANDRQVKEWYLHWIARGFAVLEKLISGNPFCFGDHVTMADVMIVPQVANARRFGLDLACYPKIVAVDAALMQLPAFTSAHPDHYVPVT